MWHVWGTGEVHTGVLWGDLVERDQLENLGVEGMMLLIGLQEVVWGSMDWISLIQDRDRWWVLVSAE
jgi:hypothetical protein